MQALRLVFVVLAVVIAALLGWNASRPTGSLRQASTAEGRQPAALPHLDQSPKERQSVEEKLAEAPEYMPFFDSFKRAFPSDYERILGGFAARAAASGRIESPDFYLAETLRSLRQTRGVIAAQAEAKPLGDVFDVQAQIMSKLAQTAPPLCVDFLYGGASAAYLDFSGRNRDLIAAMAEAALAAIIDGEAHKIQRTAPTVDDFDVLARDLIARGLTDVEIGALLDGKMPDPPLPATRMCTAGRAYFDALQNLPEATRLKMFALAIELMARSWFGQARSPPSESL